MPSNLFLLLAKWNIRKNNKLEEKIKNFKGNPDELRELQYKLRTGIIDFNEYLYKFFYWGLTDEEAKTIREEIDELKKENNKYGPLGRIKINGEEEEINHEDFIKRAGVVYNLFKDFAEDYSKNNKEKSLVETAISVFLKNEITDLAIIGIIITTIWGMINLYIIIQKKIKKMYHNNKNH